MTLIKSSRLLILGLIILIFLGLAIFLKPNQVEAQPSYGTCNNPGECIGGGQYCQPSTIPGYGYVTTHDYCECQPAFLDTPTSCYSLGYVCRYSPDGGVDPAWGTLEANAECDCNNAPQCWASGQSCKQGVIAAGWGPIISNPACSCAPNQCTDCNTICLPDGSGTTYNVSCSGLCETYIQNQMSGAQDANFWIQNSGQLGVADNFIFFDSAVSQSSENSIYVVSTPTDGFFIKLDIDDGGYDERFKITKQGHQANKGALYIEGWGAAGPVKPSVNYGPWILGDEGLVLTSDEALIYGKIYDTSDGDFIVFQTFTCPTGPFEPPDDNPVMSYAPSLYQTFTNKDNFDLFGFLRSGIAQAAVEDPAVDLEFAVADPHFENPYLPPDTRCPGGTYSDVFRLTSNGSLAINGSFTLSGPIYSGIDGEPVTIKDTDGLAVTDGDFTVGGGYGDPGLTIDVDGNLNMDGNLTVKGMVSAGGAGVVLGALENLYYGNIDTASHNLSSLLLLQNESIDKFKVSKDGDVTYYGNSIIAGMSMLGYYTTGAGYTGFHDLAAASDNIIYGAADRDNSVAKSGLLKLEACSDGLPPVCDEKFFIGIDGKIKVNGTVQLINNTAPAGTCAASNEGEMAYYKFNKSGTNYAILYMCMQTGDSAYQWTVIKQNNWVPGS